MKRAPHRHLARLVLVVEPPGHVGVFTTMFDGYVQ